jgi:hypothetical protein
LLVFLQNLNDAIGVILKRDLKLTPKGGGPKPPRLKYMTICLLMRYLAQDQSHDIVVEFGKELQGRDRVFREAIASILRSKKSGIRDELSRQFMTLDSSDASSITDAFTKTERALRLKENIDPFVAFADLDVAEETAVA